jgi:DNA-binding response OmpR family regulator
MAKILIVEDEMLLASELEAILFDRGYDVIGIAPDLATARAVADHQRPDLALACRAGSTPAPPKALQLFR